MSPTENTFGGDPDRSPLKGNPPFRGTRGPHKMYILRGAPFDTRARATALRHLRGAANYATCNAPASRRDGALLAYTTSCPTRLTRCARNNRWTFGSALCPCPMCKSGVPAKNLQGFFVGVFFGWAAPASNKRPSCIRTLRISSRRVQTRSGQVTVNNSASSGARGDNPLAMWS